MGINEYIPIAQMYQVPISVTGFEPLDLMLGILQTVQMLEKGQYQVKNAYPRVVRDEGNKQAQNIIHKAFIECDRQWRGIGLIPMSGWKLNKEYKSFDAEIRFNVENIQTKESEICISGLILQGQKKPNECPAFRTICTPQNPLGATMVSSEGTCAAYYRYGKDING
jgi:hydrogenase expression/formation protein HypD